eukprot:2415129-Heterocapsa_arctica.AAC.1
MMKAFDVEKAEEHGELSDGDDGHINVQYDDVAYAQEHFALSSTDWQDPATGKYVCEMPLRELMNFCLVKLEGEPTMTIRPWADNLNNGRC